MFLLRCALALSVALVLFQAPPADAGVDWLQIGGDASHRSYVPDDGTINRCTVKSLSLRWTENYPRSAQASPAVTASTIYVTTEGGTVAALNPHNGTPRWAVNLGTRASAPVLDGNRLYVALNDKTVRALSKEDGSGIWASTAETNGFQNPVVGSGLVVVGSQKIRAFDANTGAFRWLYGGDTGVAYEAAIVDGNVYVANDGVMHAFNVNGQEQWGISPPGWGGGIKLRTSVADGQVFAGGFSGYFGAFRASDGMLEWSDYPQGEVFAPAIAPDGVYIQSSNNRVFAYDRQGKLRWTYHTFGGLYPGGSSSAFPPTYAGGVLFVSTAHIMSNGAAGDNAILALDPRTGELLWKYSLSGERGTQPVVSNGMVLVQTERRLLAFGGETMSKVAAVGNSLFKLFIPAVPRGGDCS